MNIASMNEKLRYLIAIIGIAFLIFTFIISLWNFIGISMFQNGFILFKWLIFSISILDYIYFSSLFLLYPFFILLVKGFLGKKVVLGANDNLAVTAVAAGIGKYLSEHRPQNIEIWICSQGSEEVGDKGARAFVEKIGKRGYLDNSYNLILECCGAAEAILLVEKDMHGIVYDKEMNEQITSVINRLRKEDPNFLDFRTDKLKIRACDVVRYIENGYKATALFGVESE